MPVTAAPRPKVLVIHALRPTSRQTTIDHLLSFREHLPHCDVQYLHFQQPIPRELSTVAPDLLVVNYDYLNYRFSPLWPYIRKRHRDIARRAGNVVAIAQDDFWANRLLDNWCMDWDVDRILTPIDNDREILYPRSSRTKELRTGLTGYVRSGPVPVTVPWWNEESILDNVYGTCHPTSVVSHRPRRSRPWLLPMLHTMRGS